MHKLIMCNIVLQLPYALLSVTNGSLNMGTWQGLYLCEHRDCAGGRKVVVTLQGIAKDSGGGGGRSGKRSARK